MADQQPQRPISEFKSAEVRTIVGDSARVLPDDGVERIDPSTVTEAKAANDFTRRMAEGFSLPEEADDDGTKER